MRVADGEMGSTDKESCLLRYRTNKYFMTELSHFLQLSQPIYIHDRIYDHCLNLCGKNPEISAFHFLSFKGSRFARFGGVTGFIMFFQGMNSNSPNSNYKPDDRESSKHNQDVVMPGFRFHPTEEELVEFYLRRKVEGKHFNIELITFVDLYRYDPWELPGLAAIGEKEWFFYVPRDRKYRNGDRPNRVTASGYWKATGADRMIRDENNCCIGLKKTLVFYRGKAPKGKRTSWIMNEYRLPQLETQRVHKQNELSLCRVYKKAGQDEGRIEPKESAHNLPTKVNENGECSLAAITESFNRRPCQGMNSSEYVKLQELPVALANHDNDGREMKCKLIVDERFVGQMEFADAELENMQMQARIASESAWSLYPRAPHPVLEDLICNPCPPQLVVAYNTTLPPCSDKLWEWNPVRNNGAPC